MARLTRSTYANDVVDRVLTAVRKIWQDLPFPTRMIPSTEREEIRNTKSEIRNKFEIRSTKRMGAMRQTVLNIGISDFEFVSDFDIRISDLASVAARPRENRSAKGGPQMRLGNFSVSLSVKNLGASRAFYEKLGFKAIGGDPAQNWLILQNETASIGLFQGMFDKNMLTFNPGWDRTGSALPDFDDVRDIQRSLKSRGIALATSADESTSGPASLMLLDPDGNPILIDQHVPRPGK